LNQSLANKDKEFIWHPYTQHALEVDSVIITEAKGALLIDQHGNEIIDLISSWWTTTHGHSHPALNAALQNQVNKLDHVMFAGFSHPSAIDLAEKLLNLLPPNLTKVFFSDNGSTAVEVSLKLAYQFWKNAGEIRRNKFIAFDGAYHGDTFGAMAVGKGCGFFKIYDELLFSVITTPFPETWEDDELIEEKENYALTCFKKIIKEHSDEVAAVIIEPLIQGAAGMRFCRPGFLKKIFSIAKENKLLVIFDEVAVGFGRTGDMFVCNSVGCRPDLLCISKGLTAGYLPLSATICSEKIYDCFFSKTVDKTFLHGHTFTANPLACAVATESLDLFEREKTFDKIKNIEKRHRAFIKKIKGLDNVKKTRVLGSVLAFNLKDGLEEYKELKGEKLRKIFSKLNLNIRPIGSSVYVLPPYCISSDQLNKAYDGIIQGLEKI
tara:strand:- start:10746 stop:12053 length:1308 start_codon:yes stop_codon:yes gene_type:complete